MNENSNALRPVLIYGAILAAAVLLGFALAAGLDYDSVLFMLALFGLLISPLVLKLHQPILLLAWNSSLGLYFLPGDMPLWLPMSVLSLILLGLERTFFKERQFVNVPQLTTSLLVFGAVVVVTMLARGGIGIRWMGSGELSGGRKYLWILGAIIAFFALSIKRIPPEKAPLCCALFFLGGLTSFIGPLVVWLGPPFNALQFVFNPIEGVAASQGMFRVKGMSYVGSAIVGYLLARYGFGGVFHTSRIWRPMLLLFGVLLGLLSGYRTLLVLFGVSLVLLFFMEGWHRTRWIWGWALSIMTGIALLIPLTPHLPTPVQRALAFLPLPVDPIVTLDAEGTIEWREGLWQTLADDVPRYFWLGKGMAVSTVDMDWADTLRQYGAKPWYTAYLVGEHHNGFLSVTIAFGVWGLMAFLVFTGTGFWVLLQNFRFGEIRLRHVNAFLLTNYIGWVLLFFTYWGTLYWTMRDFVGILGLSVALNAGLAQPPSEDSPAANPEDNLL